MDRKWGRILGEVAPELRRRIAGLLGLPDPGTLAFAPNTHEFFKRVVSCFPREATVRVLASDAEFHSFERQGRRWEESGRLRIERVPAEPFGTFADRLADAARREKPDLVYVSHVFYNSGFVFEEVDEFVRGLPDDVWVMIDGYHAFGALPVDLSGLAGRAFYTAGGYKYAMSGEGACFLHCPPGWGPRPDDTGWYAGFGELEQGAAEVGYATDGDRFAGSTFDPSGLYRMRAVLELWEETGFGPEQAHAHAHDLQRRFLDGLDAWNLGALSRAALVPDESVRDRGNFLTFRIADAAARKAALDEANVIVDCRGDRLRFGFGIYQTAEDVERLGGRLRKLFA